jgi:Protein of unknown function (DUF2637)
MMDMAHEPQHERNGRAEWQAIAASVLIGAVVAILLAYGIAASYESLTRLAAEHSVPLARYYPVGLDGGLVGTIILDIVLTWLGHAISWLRQVARLFAIGTVAANAFAGWPDPAGVLMRISAPVLIVIIAEALRTVLLRRSGERRDPVPLARWVLSPWPTWKLYRRMVLWGITSYPEAVDMEISRRQAIVRLTSHYRGRDWREAAPGDLVWMLENGLRMGEALGMVEALCGPPTASSQATASTPGKRLPPARRAASRKRQGRDIDTQAQALAHYLADRDISGSELGRRLGLSPSRGRAILAELKQSAPHTGPMPAVRTGD